MKNHYLLLFSILLFNSQINAQVALTSPNGGENWTVGSTHQITFSGTGSAVIQYSTNNGVSWNNVTYNSTSPYAWVIPNTPSTQCLVKIQWCGSCADTSNAVFTISSSTGLSNNNSLSKVLKIYPNPCNSILHFKIGNNEKEKIEIINIVGESVLTGEITLHSTSIDISEFPAGIYFLKYRVDEDWQYEKFLKTNY